MRISRSPLDSVYREQRDGAIDLPSRRHAGIAIDGHQTACLRLPLFQHKSELILNDGLRRKAMCEKNFRIGIDDQEARSARYIVSHTCNIAADPRSRYPVTAVNQRSMRYLGGAGI